MTQDEICFQSTEALIQLGKLMALAVTIKSRLGGKSEAKTIARALVHTETRLKEAEQVELASKVQTPGKGHGKGGAKGDITTPKKLEGLERGELNLETILQQLEKREIWQIKEIMDDLTDIKVFIMENRDIKEDIAKIKKIRHKGLKGLDAEIEAGHKKLNEMLTTGRLRLEDPRLGHPRSKEAAEILKLAAIASTHLKMDIKKTLPKFEIHERLFQNEIAKVIPSLKAGRKDAAIANIDEAIRAKQFQVMDCESLLFVMNSIKNATDQEHNLLLHLEEYWKEKQALESKGG